MNGGTRNTIRPETCDVGRRGGSDFSVAHLFSAHVSYFLCNFIASFVVCGDPFVVPSGLSPRPAVK